MTYSISCVLLVPALHRETINQLADAMGYGPNNMSCELTHTNGSAWYGCHTWCVQSFLDQLASPPEEAGLIPGSTEALAALIVSSVDGGDPTAHWNQALTLNGLSYTQPLAT